MWTLVVGATDVRDATVRGHDHNGRRVRLVSFGVKGNRIA